MGAVVGHRELKNWLVGGSAARGGVTTVCMPTPRFPAGTYFSGADGDRDASGERLGAAAMLSKTSGFAFADGLAAVGGVAGRKEKGENDRADLPSGDGAL